MERTAIEAQDAIGWDHFIRGRTAKAFGPAIQNYYNNNKIKSFSAHLRWSNAINKCNFSTHQSAWKNYCAEIASPVRTKKSISQRKLYLLSLVEKYYNQAADLPQLQSQWFARPIVKYQKWRIQELINWKEYYVLRVTRKKISLRTPRKRLYILYWTIRWKKMLQWQQKTEFIQYIPSQQKRN